MNLKAGAPPRDWDSKATVQDYQLRVSLVNVADEIVEKTLWKPKVNNGPYGDFKRDLYFDLERSFCLMRRPMVEWVKLNVPNLFPPQFSEGLVRSWVKARKRKREAEEDETGPEEGCKPPPGAAMLDRGSDPRGQGNRILP